ncbi:MULTISPECIES: sensor domain-containing protein [unclassified Streptomyces]|uniref:sensor histidine kinase n=1 Tax=unclassified Streptomyces TaxID=2593676 RepID=UPI002DDA445A|nr:MULTISPECIES: sensor domain-containing protein [unclassified Streptomyces]WSA93032.1 sensor domain-containing protein [Streptomyces sp. NBC_01795]WSB77402.1 sensor domain-containing protein [Streptomyces sp. NBC_01775]WSS14332.1 sensor domain-containing protein [Streptomyces sp. NBC_01186]WSS43150.1 sensor domain-containing protein [Streptomyces sp. NBC_01187]
MNASPPSPSSAPGAHGAAAEGAHGAAAGVPPGAEGAAESLPPPKGALSPQTWREIAHLLLSVFTDTLAFFYIAAGVWVGGLLAVTVVGLPALACLLLGCRQIGKFERARARVLLRLRIDEPSPLHPGRPGFLGWIRAQLSDPVAWRQALYSFIRLPWGWFTAIVTACSLVAWPALPWVARGLTNVDRLLIRVLLSPSDVLERRVAELESDRGVVVDTAAADLRRIERDLHDGAQARLVSLAMGLGLAKEKLHEDPHTAAQMVDHAHDEAKIALQELRDLARGIHPAILTDRGLGPALSTLTARCTTPVTLNTDLTQRPAPAIEGIAYYTASELLQNLTKHSQAPHATLDIWRTPHHLLLQIHDQGKGGATPHPGSGLTGLADRLNAVDGLLIINSPPGGPTTITAQLPWR